MDLVARAIASMLRFEGQSWTMRDPDTLCLLAFGGQSEGNMAFDSFPRLSRVSVLSFGSLFPEQTMYMHP